VQRLRRNERFISLVTPLEYELNQAVLGRTFNPAKRPIPLSIHQASSALYRSTQDSFRARKDNIEESRSMIEVSG